MSLFIVKCKKTKLKANLSASASQITLDELVDSQNNAIVTASFGEWFVLVVKQGDQIEMIKCTAVTQNPNGSATITVAPTGRNLTPVFPYVGVPTGYSFLSGAEVIVTNDPLTVMSFTNKKNDETVEGLWTFTQTPLGLNAGAVNDASTTAKGIGRASSDPTVTLGTVTMTIASPAVFTKTAHGLTLNDMVKFTTTVSLPTGIVAGTTYYVMSTGLTANDFQLSASQGGSAINTSGSQAGVHTLYKNTPVFVIDTDSRLLTQNQKDALGGDNGTPSDTNKFVTQTGLQNNSEKYAVDSGANDSYSITLSPVPSAYTVGMVVNFKANTINTGTATLNVNGIGAITIVKGVNTTLSNGDILAGQLCKVIYDGTNFVLQNPVGTNTIAIATSLGTWASASQNTNTQVTADSFLVGYVSFPNNNISNTTIATDSSATPSTVRNSIIGGSFSTTGNLSFCVPVKKNDYYRISVGASHTVTAYIIPLA